MGKTIKVTLREKKLKGDMISLYLDIYPPILNAQTGKETRREFLGMQIHANPQGATQKEYNHVTKLKADEMRNKRALEFQNDRFEMNWQNTNKRDFLAYFKEKVEGRKTSKGNYDNWYSTYHYLCEFTNGKCKFGDVDDAFCERFKKFMETTNQLNNSNKKLSQNSQHSYFNKFKTSVDEAFGEKLFYDNPVKRIKCIPAGETFREYLSVEEMKKLRVTDCDNPLLKRASFFSSLTGLRFSDVTRLKWSDVKYGEEQGGNYIQFISKKPGTPETLTLSDLAYKELGERNDNNEPIFKELKYSDSLNNLLRFWVLKAGITNKKISFHCFRHTFATQLLAAGVDIYTVSKLLGHKSVKTTERYVKVINLSKINAMNLLQF
jgi:integrase